MPDIWFDVDIAISEAPVNILPLLDDTDFKTRETAVAYNAAGMDLVWNFVTTGGAYTQTAVTPTTAGSYDWTHQGDGMYSIEIPASGGASINNDTEGFGWFSGVATGVLPWRGPVIGFRAAALNDALTDGGDNLDVNVVQFGGTNATASGGRPEVNTSHIAGSAVSTASAQIGVNVVNAGGTAWASGSLTSGVFAAGAITASALAADAITDAKVAADVTIASVTGAVGSVTGNVGGNVTGSVGSIAAGGISASSFAAGAIDATAIAADAIGSSELAASAANEIADAILDRDMSTGTDSGSTTVRTVRQALRFLRNKWAISGTTLTVYKEDDSTASWSGTLSTTAGVDPVTGNDPAGP